MQMLRKGLVFITFSLQAFIWLMVSYINVALELNIVSLVAVRDLLRRTDPGTLPLYFEPWSSWLVGIISN